MRWLVASMQKVASAFSPESFESFLTAGLLARLISQAFPPRLIGTVAGDWKIILSIQLRGQLRNSIPTNSGVWVPDSLLIFIPTGSGQNRNVPKIAN
jgi:hypothetical protein